MAVSDILYAGVLQHMQSGVLALGTDGRVRAFNPAAERLLGLPASRIEGELFASLFFEDPANDRFAQAVLDAIYDPAASHQVDLEYHRGDAVLWLNVITSVLWEPVPAGRAPCKAGVVVVFVDITSRKAAEAALRRANDELEQRVEQRTRDLAQANLALRQEVAERVKAQAQLAHLADHDALTGLPNRRLFEQRMGEAIDAAERFSLLYLDLDGFKAVNDGHGHAVGDWLLRRVAQRLGTCLREEDTLARLGGDEFAVVLRSTHAPAGEDGTLAVVTRIIDHISEPYHTERGAELRIGVSIGFAQHPQVATTSRELVQAADVAMYEAKRGGRGTWRRAPVPT